MKDTKFEKVVIKYNAKKFSCPRIKTMENVTRKATFKAIAKLMAKGYTVELKKINGIPTERYIEQVFCE